MSRTSVSLAIPAFNEERRLPALLEELRTTAGVDLAAGGLELLEAVVVDDGSTDATAALLAAAPAPVRAVFHRGPNRGKGHATALAVAEAAGDLVLFTDVDLAAPLAEAGKLHAALRAGADVVVGSRAVDPTMSRTPPHRQVVGRVFNLLVRSLTGLPIRDTQCGFKLMRTDVARSLLAAQITEGYAFDVEVLMRARGRGLRIAEVPVRYDHDEDSRVSVLRAGAQMLVALARLTWHLRVRSRVLPADASAERPELVGEEREQRGGNEREGLRRDGVHVGTLHEKGE